MFAAFAWLAFIWRWRVRSAMCTLVVLGGAGRNRIRFVEAVPAGFGDYFSAFRAVFPAGFFRFDPVGAAGHDGYA